MFNDEPVEELLAKIEEYNNPHYCPTCNEMMAHPSGVDMECHAGSYKDLYLCLKCLCWYNEKLEFLQTI